MPASATQRTISSACRSRHRPASDVSQRLDRTGPSRSAHPGVCAHIEQFCRRCGSSPSGHGCATAGERCIGRCRSWLRGLDLQRLIKSVSLDENRTNSPWATEAHAIEITQNISLVGAPKSGTTTRQRSRSGERRRIYLMGDVVPRAQKLSARHTCGREPEIATQSSGKEGSDSLWRAF
jgi:hypothetical protein